MKTTYSHVNELLDAKAIGRCPEVRYNHGYASGRSICETARGKTQETVKLPNTYFGSRTSSSRLRRLYQGVAANAASRPYRPDLGRCCSGNGDSVLYSADAALSTTSRNMGCARFMGVILHRISCWRMERIHPKQDPLSVHPVPAVCRRRGVLLRTSKARTWLLAGVVALGVLMAVLSIVSPNEQAAINGRLAVDGSNAIAAGRAAGAAVVVLLVLALGRSRQWRLAVLAAMGLSLSMIAAGSRGPLLAAIIAVIIVSTAPRSARKVQRLALGLGALALAWWVASQLQLIPERLIAGIILVIVLVKALKRQWEVATTPVEMAMLGLFIFFLQPAMVTGDVNSNRGVWIALGAGLVAVQSAPTSPKKRSKRDANTRLLNQTPSARVCHLSPAVKHWVRGGLHAPNCRAWRASRQPQDTSSRLLTIRH
jgi:MFS family permease